MQTQELKPYLFAFLARQRDAIGEFYPIRRCLALPEDSKDDMLEVVSRCPDLEIQAITLVCEMTNGQSFPAPEGPAVAYELLNDTGSGPASIGFIREADFGDGIFRKVKKAVQSCDRPFVKTWTYNQIRDFAARNAIRWIQ